MFPPMKAFIRMRSLLALTLVSGAAALLLAEPTWWVQRGVRDPAKAPNDYAALNQGQLKHLFFAARQELNEKLPGGAGDEIEQTVAQWGNASAQAKDFSGVNQGQLKALVSQIYARFTDFNLPIQRPWTVSSTDDMDYALVNLGQAKAAFDFVVPGDSDGDGINDALEWKYFNGLGHDLNGDSDGDLIADGVELLNGGDPLGFSASASQSPVVDTLGLRVFNELRL